MAAGRSDRQSSLRLNLPTHVAQIENTIRYEAHLGSQRRVAL